MRAHISRKAMKFMTRYIVTWVAIGVIAVTFILLTGAKQANITCVDGSQVTDKALCPQCTEDSHCGPDRVCSGNTCIAKACVTEDDCDTPQSACIFEKCTKSSGKI